MSKQQKSQLLKQIALIAEKAYRRGFQHGHYAARGKMGSQAPSSEQVTEWRFAAHSRTHAVGPPGTRYAGRREGLLDRLSYEVNDDHDDIQSMLFEIKETLA